MGNVALATITPGAQLPVLLVAAPELLYMDYITIIWVTGLPG